MARVRQIDKAVPSLEKVVLAQRSHLHLAYTAGCNWHASVKCGQNHFASGDMPEFIIDSYEDCRGPPRFHLLDKFDPGGPGSCLRRYSDPALFKRASTGYGEESTKKIEKDKEVHRTERRRSRLRNGKVSRGASIPNHSVRMEFPQLNVDDQDSASQTAPVNEKTLRSDFVDQPKIASRNELGYIECVNSPSYSTKPHPQECRESPSSSKRQSNVSPSCNFVREKGSDVHDDSQNNFSVEKIGYSPSVTWDEKEEMHEPLAECDRNGNLGLLPKDSLSPSRRKLGDSPGYNFLEENYSDVYDDTRNSLSLEQTGHSSSSVNWDEKAEILEHTTEYDRDEYLGSLPSNFELQMHGCKADNFKIFEQIDIPPCNETVPVPESGDNQLDDHHFLDTLNTIQSESETDKDCTMKHELLHMTGEDGKVSTCSQSSILSSNKDEGKPDPAGNSDNDEHGIHMDCITSCEDYREDGISCRKESWKHSPADNFKIFEQIDIPPCNETVPVPESGDNQLDDHHFLDALNTTQSESETDKDCTTKHELQHYSDLEDKVVIDDTRGLETCESEFHSSNFEYDISENKSLINASDGCISTSGTDSCDPISEFPQTASASYTVSSKHRTHLQSTQKVSELLNPCTLQGVDSHKNDNIYDEEKAELVLGKVSSSHSVEDTSRMPIVDRTTSSSESQVPAPEPSSIASVMFWTNGGLLGLEPSKPPDCSVLSAIPRDHMTGEDGKVSTCSQSSILSSNKDEGKPDPVGNSDNGEHGIHMDCITSCEDYREDGISCRKESWKHSPADLNVNLENFSDSTHRQYDKTQAVNSEVQMPEEHQQNNQSSSQMSELDNRLTNGSNNRLSLAMYENYGPTNDVKADVLKQDNDPIVLPTIMSPSSSPPLERMKILFCPLQDFEMSKLKLKFPDGNGNPESSRDFFPSFQLVPEPDFAWHNVGSESDNHTFYSSSPSVSDDCLSHQSESNSEQWESSECRSNKDDNLYNALYRISLTDSISTQNESTSHGEICDSTELRFHHSLNLPSLDSLNHSFGEDRLNTLSEGPKIANHAVHLKLSASTISQDQIVETIDLLKSKHVQENIPKETNQVARGKSMDEQGDLLSQTRTKSINDFRSISLRPTVSIKPTTPMGPPANANITAILEKANAIRQAVGSDDGEDDDNWSDT